MAAHLEGAHGTPVENHCFKVSILPTFYKQLNYLDVDVIDSSILNYLNKFDSWIIRVFDILIIDDTIYILFYRDDTLVWPYYIHFWKMFVACAFGIGE